MKKTVVFNMRSRVGVAKRRLKNPESKEKEWKEIRQKRSTGQGESETWPVLRSGVNGRLGQGRFQVPGMSTAETGRGGE